MDQIWPQMAEIHRYLRHPLKNTVLGGQIQISTSIYINGHSGNHLGATKEANTYNLCYSVQPISTNVKNSNLTSDDLLICRFNILKKMKLGKLKYLAAMLDDLASSFKPRNWLYLQERIMEADIWLINIRNHLNPKIGCATKNRLTNIQIYQNVLVLWIYSISIIIF